MMSLEEGNLPLCNNYRPGILGYDVKVMRQIVRLRKQDSNERQEMEALLDLYLHALGMAAGE